MYIGINKYFKVLEMSMILKSMNIINKWMENLKRNENLHRSQWQFSIFENSSTLNEKILLDLVTSGLNTTKEKKGN